MNFLSADEQAAKNIWRQALVLNFKELDQLQKSYSVTVFDDWITAIFKRGNGGRGIYRGMGEYLGYL